MIIFKQFWQWDPNLWNLFDETSLSQTSDTISITVIHDCVSTRPYFFQ